MYSCTQNTLSHSFFSCAQFVRVCCQMVIVTFAHLAWLKSKMKHCASSKIVHTIAQHVVHYTFDDQDTFTWHLRSLLHKDTTCLNFLHLSSETNPFPYPQEASIGYLAEPSTFTLHKCFCACILCVFFVTCGDTDVQIVRFT